MNETYRIIDPKRLSNISQVELEGILERLAESIPGEENFDDQNALVLYAITDLYSKGRRDFTENEVVERYNDLLTGHIFRKLSANDFIDVSIDESGEAYYKITEKGRNEVERILANEEDT